MRHINRRQFLNKTLRGAAGISLGAATFSLARPRHVLGANERVNIALIGCGGRGRYLARGMVELGTEITCLCDLHQGRLDRTAAFLAEVQDRKPKIVKDMRKVFDAKDVDAVIVGTPDHWHAPASILACQAEKDVYVEKPHSHNIWESYKMIEAARKYNRILQVGTQCRSAPYVHSAVEYIKSGKVGDIHLVKVYNLKRGGPFHLGDPGTPPEGFDWDAWLGAASKRPYQQNIFVLGWHKFWDFSGGDLTDDGIHQLDLAMMLMGDPGMPKAVSCSGGRLQHKGDDAEVPDVQIATFDFDGFVVTFELTGYLPYMRKTTGTIRRTDKFPYWTQNATRIELYGSKLMMTVGRHGGGWQATTSGPTIVDQMYGRAPDAEHEKNFIECVKSRKRPNADIKTVHPTLTMVHMANIAHRVGNQKLWFDSKAERFIGNEEANKLLKRKYRKKYEVSERV
jgi:predicted dehydrogenase